MRPHYRPDGSGGRSGKQSIIESSKTSGTSTETEIKLTNVARASLEELLKDYRDFMREREISEWERNPRYARRLSELNRTPDADYKLFALQWNTKISESEPTPSWD